MFFRISPSFFFVCTLQNFVNKVLCLLNFRNCYNLMIKNRIMSLVWQLNSTDSVFYMILICFLSRYLCDVGQWQEASSKRRPFNWRIQLPQYSVPVGTKWERRHRAHGQWVQVCRRTAGCFRKGFHTAELRHSWSSQDWIVANDELYVHGG